MGVTCLAEDGLFALEVEGSARAVWWRNEGGGKGTQDYSRGSGNGLCLATPVTWCEFHC